MNKLILTSWDDGNQLDMELAEMLLKYQIPAVFYVPIKSDLLDYQIKKLAGISDSFCPTCEKTKKLFDIGAHTINHPEDLRQLSKEDAFREIKKSKEKLEAIIKRPVTRFCYPSGRFDNEIKDLVRKAGYKEARITRSGSIEFPADPLETRPTAHVHPEKRYGEFTWKEYAEGMLDKVIKEGGRFEIWGHSWEIEMYNMWEFLDDFLFYMDKKLKKINYPRKI